MNAFLTVEEAADRLGVEYKTVYRLVRSGELPAGKVGRIYRIRDDDLEAFFERQKRLLGEHARRTGLTALEGRICGGCDKPIVSKLSIAGRCESCGREICLACWAIRKRRSCAAHADEKAAHASPAGRPSLDIALGGDWAGAKVCAAANPAAIAAELRSQGKPAITCDEARLAAESFLRAFAQRFESIEELPDPLSRRSITLRRVRVRHVLEPDDRRGGPSALSRAVRFVLRAGGWGRPTAGLALEARFVVRDDRLRTRGYDVEPLGEAELAPFLSALRERAKAEDVFHVALLGSPTGWSRSASALVTQPAGARSFRDRRVGLSLCDLHTESCCLDERDERLREFWPLLSPGRFAEELERCGLGVRELAAKLSGVGIDYAARTLGVPPGWVSAAFTALAKTGQYVVSELPKLGAVLSRR